MLFANWFCRVEVYVALINLVKDAITVFLSIGADCI